MNINELLDELQNTAIDRGFYASSPNIVKAARAAVDAEVKALQDRIADLERELAYVKNAPAF